MNCVRKYNLKSVNTKRADFISTISHRGKLEDGWFSIVLMFSSDLKMKKSLSNGDKRILSSLFVPFTFYC